MRSLARAPGIEVARMIGVYRGNDVLAFDAVDILPVPEFLRRLHAGKVF